MEGSTLKDPRPAIHQRIAQKEVRHEAVVPSTDGNLALASKAVNSEVVVTTGDERPEIIEAFVVGLTGCLGEMRASDRNDLQLGRSLMELRNVARRYQITAAEIVGELARQGGVNIDLVLLAKDVDEDREQPENDDDVTDTFKHLVSPPQFYDHALDDHWQEGVVDGDRGIGHISTWFPRVDDETYGMHITHLTRSRDYRGKFIAA